MSSATDYDFTLGGTYSVEPNKNYWLAILTTGSVSTLSSSARNVAVKTIGRTYASGFLANPAGLADGGTSPFPVASATLTLSNAGGVCELIEDGDTTYVYDATTGHEDLYDLANLAVTPTSIIAVQSRMFAKKSDSGSRNGQIRVKSGATEVGGTDTALPTSYAWLNRVDAVDPNTSAAWTASAVNALQVGPKVTA
jgi:hypothetical protein